MERKELIARLRKDALEHKEVAHCCDCPPENTQNWKHMQTCLDAADMLEADAQPAVPQEKEPNNDAVICPSCCTQFRAIPVNVQQLMLDAGFKPPFKAAPHPQRPRLTDEEIDALAEWHALDFMTYMPFARAIERKVRGEA